MAAASGHATSAPLPGPSSVRTALPEVIWPALPPARAAQILSLQQQFRQSERCAVEDRDAAQLLQLRRFVAWAGTGLPWYRERLRHAGIEPGAPFSWQAFRRIPVLQRADVQGLHASFAALAAPPDHGAARDGATSGSTGVPVRFRRSGLADLFEQAIVLRDHLWHQRDLTGRLAAIRFTERGSSSSSWGGAVAEVFPTGPSDVLPLSTPLERQVDWIVERAPTYLMVTASVLRELARVFLERGLTLHSLREVRTFGEVVGEDVREVVRAAWNVGIVDAYSASETGTLALQCPAHAHFHVQSECALVEVLDDAGEPCAPGAIGRVVVTPFLNFAMPLLRYDIGDYAEVGAPCDCGRTLPVLRRIAGRVRNMLVYPDGQRRWPTFDLRALAALGGIRQLQFVQPRRDTLLVRIATTGTGGADWESRFRAIVCAALGYPFDIVFERVERIERTAGGKFEDFRCECD